MQRPSGPHGPGVPHGVGRLGHVRTLFPFTASLVGMPVVVTGIDFDGDERRGLVAAVERDRTSATISLLDLDVTETEKPVARLVAAYRRWLGTT